MPPTPQSREFAGSSTIHRRVARLLLVLVLALGWAGAAPAQVACACSCVGWNTTEALAGADVVFAGRVIAARPAGSQTSYTIAVERVYKGTIGAEATVTSGDHEWSCGLQLVGAVTVFAFSRGGALQTGLCWVPMALDPKALGPGSPPAPAVTPTSTPEPTIPQPASPSVGWLAVPAVLIASLAGWWWVSRRRGLISGRRVRASPPGRR